MNIIFKYLTLTVFFLSLTVLFHYSLLAAPSAQFLALNKNTGECGLFWPGDEFQSYELPVGWETYGMESYYKINTSLGSCSVKEGDSYESCCNQLNLSIVDPKKVPTKTSPYTCEFNDRYGWNKIQLYGGNDGIAVNSFTRECTAYLSFKLIRPSGESAGYENGSDAPLCLGGMEWKNYKMDRSASENIYLTSRGTCKTGSIESCCKTLGLKYVSKISDAGKNNNVKLLFSLGVLAVFVLLSYLIKRNKNSVSL